jgi:glycosyltransferase involved in cell wall biosynthesis
MDLLSGAEFNVRLFATPYDRSFLSRMFKMGLWLAGTRQNSGFSQDVPPSFYQRIIRRICLLLQLPSYVRLALLIKRWKPGIIHTLGLFDGQGGQFYLEARQKFQLQNHGKWVLQLRGGSDMALRWQDPQFRQRIQQALSQCDQIISDNVANIRYAGKLGISADKFAPITPVPGSGGLDVSLNSARAWQLPSKRERLILWPKAYESRWSEALPVLEAIQLAWGTIMPCRIYMLAVSDDLHEWYLSMPEEIRKHCCLKQRLPRQDVLSLMKQARVLLAPSLIDGVPNSLYEAMANGAFPIVSPLETITPVVKQEANVLFARNLYPDEIAAALIRAMTDDSLIDRAAGNNIELVAGIANRQTIRVNVVNYYNQLAGMS